MSRIREAFDTARANGRAVLVAYITAGDPSPEHTASLVLALERGGAGVIELGVPFSDPIADGPVIQRGSDRALKAGTNVARVLDIAREVRRHSEIPLLLFSYLNPLLRFGFDRLAHEACQAGVDGVLLTDLSVEEAAHHVPALRAAGLDTVFLAAPTSTPERLDAVARFSSGFVYLVSRTGVTGERQDVAASTSQLVEAIRGRTDLPLVVGFGISTAEQVRRIAGIADGVAVGSALVRVIEENAGAADLDQKLESFTRTLAGGLAK